MNIQESIRRILKEDKKTKSTNKEFSKYKDSKFNSLRDYTLQDIVDDWDSLSDHKNENIKTIKHFVNNPDKITDLVYDEKGLEDGYHRLIAAKILKKPRFSYRLVENLQESIRKILMEEFPQEDYSNQIIKNVSAVDSVIRSLYPNFNKVGVYKKRIFPIGWSIPLDCYFDNETNLKYASIYKKKRELRMDKDIQNTLNDYLGEDVATYVIDWFNNEFDTNAEYVTF